MKGNIITGAALVSSGAYALAYVHFHPDKLSERMPLGIFRLLCVAMIFCGLLVAVAPLFFEQ